MAIGSLAPRRRGRRTRFYFLNDQGAFLACIVGKLGERRFRRTILTPDVHNLAQLRQECCAGFLAGPRAKEVCLPLT